MEYSHWLNIALPVVIASATSVFIAFLARKPNASMVADKLAKAEATLMQREEALRASLFRRIEDLQVALNACEEKHEEVQGQLIVEIDARQELESRCRRLEHELDRMNPNSPFRLRGDTS